MTMMLPACPECQRAALVPVPASRHGTPYKCAHCGGVFTLVFAGSDLTRLREVCATAPADDLVAGCNVRFAPAQP